VTDHGAIDVESIVEHGELVFDTRNALAEYDKPQIHSL